VRGSQGTGNMGDVLQGRSFAMGPRIPTAAMRARDLSKGSLTWGLNLPSRVMSRAAESSCTQANLCEKPVGGQSMTVAIALGVW